jgi:hypothetical protein
VLSPEDLAQEAVVELKAAYGFLAHFFGKEARPPGGLRTDYIKHWLAILSAHPHLVRPQDPLLSFMLNCLFSSLKP